MTESARNSAAPAAATPSAAPLPPELEARIAAFERAAPVADFDKSGWFWMMLLGIAIPVVLLVAGWWA
jgi:hypothetical protein